MLNADNGTTVKCPHYMWGTAHPECTRCFPPKPDTASRLDALEKEVAALKQQPWTNEPVWIVPQRVYPPAPIWGTPFIVTSGTATTDLSS